MIKKILISNIGNRNLKYKGEYILKNTFREKTKELFQNYNKEHKYLQINILDILLDKKRDQIEEVILIASDQNGEHNHQDTLYEAKIMAMLIEQKYRLSTHITTLKCSVVDNNELLRNFRHILNSINRKHEEKNFIICDSGGTAQQKSSLKIMTEYILPAHRFHFFHITEQTDGQSVVTEINQLEYRKVIDSEQMIRLITAGNYHGALSIYQYNHSTNSRSTKIKTLLQFAVARKGHIKNEARKYSDPKAWSWKNERILFLEDYCNKRPAGKHYRNFSDFMKEDDFFYLCELLSIAEYCYELKDYNNAILYYQIFVESYLYAALKPEFDLTSPRYEAEMNNIAKQINNDPKLLAEFKRRELIPDRKGIPMLGLFTKFRTDNEVHQQMLENIFKTNGKLAEREIPGLDGLRNSYAHKGNGITSEKIRSSIPGWEQIRGIWQSLLGLPSENIFLQMNETIIGYLK